MKINIKRAKSILSRTGHDPNDSECTFWRGDFAGVNLRARCPICSPQTEDEVKVAWVRQDGHCSYPACPKRPYTHGTKEDLDAFMRTQGYTETPFGWYCADHTKLMRALAWFAKEQS